MTARTGLRWQSLLFMVGGSGFTLASLPFMSSAFDPVQVAWVYVVSACFFTSAAFVQLVLAVRAGIDVNFWASIIQFAGTLFFNSNTINALREAQGSVTDNLLVWRPEFWGSVCFLVASWLALLIRGDDGRAFWRERWSASVDARSSWWNMVGSILFMVSTLSAYVVPSTGEPIKASLINSTTALGAACFVWAAWIVLPRGPVRGDDGLTEPS